MDISTLYAERTRLSDEILALGKLAEASDLTDEQYTTLRSLNAQRSEVESRIAKREETRKIVEEASKIKTPEAKSTIKTVSVDSNFHPRPDGRSFFASAEDAKVACEFLRSVSGNLDSRSWLIEHGLGKHANMNITDNADGGFLVPTVLENAIVKLRNERGVFAREAAYVPMTTQIHNKAKSDSGVTAYAVDEDPSSDVNKSTPVWSNIQLTAKPWAAEALTTISLEQDSIVNLANELTEQFAYAFATAQDATGFIGDGTSTYHSTLGVLPKLNSVAGSFITAASGNNTFGTLDEADLLNVIGKCAPYALSGAKWYMSSPAFYAISNIPFSKGGVTVEQVENGIQYRLYGYPVVLVDQMPSALTGTASTMALAFGNLQLGAAFGERPGIYIQRLNEKYVSQSKVGWFALTRFAVNIHDVKAAGGAVTGLKFNS